MDEILPRLFVGVDWATTAHQVCVLRPDGQVLEELSVRHSGEGLARLCERLLELAEGEAAAAWVAIEVPHGAVVETLLERGFVVHSINPKQLDRFRDRFTVAGAKDDRRDALVLADSLRTDTRRYRRLQLDDPVTIELREWSRMAEELQEEHCRLTNRLREQLRRYYPQALELTSDVGTDWFADLWCAVPTPETARKVRKARVAAILRRHRIRKHSAEHVLDVLRQQAVLVAPGTVEAATAHVRLVLDRLQVVNRQVRECHRHLDELTARLTRARDGDDGAGQGGEQRDATILQSLPGIGRIVLATLLAEASQPLRERDYQALRTLGGLAPVTRQSGKRRVVVMRQACHPRLRRAFYHWGRVAIQHDPVARKHYDSHRASGHSHGRALRGVTDRLLAVACAMLRAGTSYDPARRRAA
jgi:transposase